MMKQMMKNSTALIRLTELVVALLGLFSFLPLAQGSTFLFHSAQDESELISSAFSVAEGMFEISSLKNEKAGMASTLLENMTEESGEISLRRHLALGDFEEFNALFRSAVIRLPDVQLSQKVIGIDLTLDISNLRCTEIQVGDIVVTYQRVSPQRLTFQVNILDLDIRCDLDYGYKYGFIGGDGSCTAYTDNNGANAELVFTSTDFDATSQTTAAIETCNADINVSSFSFSGDWIGAILDTFEFLIRNTVESEVAGALCNELQKLDDTTIQGLLNNVTDMLEPNLTPLTLQMEDLLAAETSLQVPEGIVLLNFGDTENLIGQWFNSALDEADALLATPMQDSGSPTGTGQDLGVNVFLRDFLLDEDRALNILVSDLPFGTDGVIYQGQDRLTDTKISIDSIKIFGFDTFTKFDPLSDIGNYTLRNELSWEFLTLQLGLTIDIKPSTTADSLLEDPGDVNIVETIKIEFGLDNVDADVSLLLAINQEALGDLRIGPLLDFSTLVPCLTSVLFDLELTGLDVKIANVRQPALDGFLSAGVDRVLSRSVDALFLRYETVLLKAMPGLFHNVIRDFVNESFLKSVFTNTDTNDCPLLDFGDDAAIDFRDLLLKPDLAANVGGSGTEPYGSVASSVIALVQDQISALDDGGLPSINSLLIRPLTKSQSGIEGSLVFPEELFGSSLIEGFQVSFFNTRIQNVDTVTAPLSVLQPSSEPQVLTNLINIGPVSGKALNGSVSLLLSVGDNESPFTSRDEVDISLSLPSSRISANILAKLATNGLMQFPLRDVMNPNCWLSVFATPAPGEASSSLALESFFWALSSLSLDIQCVSCTSSGILAVPSVIGTLEQTGAIDTLRGRLVSFANELVLGEFVQTQLDRLLEDAPKACPHRQEYEEDAIFTDYGPIGVPALSFESVESIIYACALLIQVAAIGVTETYATYDLSTSDFLSGQNALQVPEGTQLLDWTALDETIGDLVGTGIDGINEYLGGQVDDVGGPNGDSDLGINVQLRNLLLDGNRALTVSLDDIKVVAGDTVVALNELRILGLDTFTSFQALELVAPQTVRNKVGWDELRIELDILVGYESSASDPNVVTVSFGMRQVDASVSLLAALDQNMLASLKFGSLMNTAQILPCLLSTALAMEMTELLVSVDAVDWLSVEGLRSDGLDSALSTARQALVNEYGDRIVSAIPGVFDIAIRGMINNWIKNYMDLETSVSCPVPELEKSGSGIVDFRDMFLDPKDAIELGGSGLGQYGDLVLELRNFINDQILQVDPEDGLSSINDFLIAPLTADTGIFAYTKDLLNTGAEIDVGGLNGVIELKVYNLRIENLDTIGEPLSLLNPVNMDPNLLSNTATFGVASEPLRFGLTLLVGFAGADNALIRNEIDINVDLSSATVVLGTLIKIAETRLVSFPLRDVTNLNCWLATLPTTFLDPRGIRLSDTHPNAALSDLGISIASIGLNVTCISCSGPDMEEFTQLISSPLSAEDVTEVANNILASATKLLSGDFLQVQIDRLLAEAPKKCPHRDEYEENPSPAVYEPFEAVDSSEDSVGFLIVLAVMAAVLLLLVVVLMYVIRLIVRRRHRKWLRSLPGHSIVVLHRQQKEEAEKEAELNTRTTSMFRSKAVPFYVRCLVPLIILGNIALFLSGHLSRGGSVTIEAELGGQQLSVDDFFEFSIARSALDIWNAGGKELALIMLVFSGIWPYTKQLITLALWFLPPRIVPVSRRGTILLWLDALGKWSMIDIFVLVVTIAAFRITVESPDVSFLPEGFYSISLLVVPMWGLYANMTAQLVSQVSSHFIIHYHRRIVNVAMEDQESSQRPADFKRLPSEGSWSSNTASGPAVRNADTTPEKLCHHAFARPHRGQSDKLCVRRVVHPLLVVVAVSLSILVVLGCVFPTFSVEVLGVLGVAVESGQRFEEAKTYHNIFTLVQLLMDEAKFLGSAGDYIGLGMLSVILILTVLVVPLLQTMMLLRQWFFPMKDQAHFRTRVAIEILQAWQYMEVYLLAVIVSVWQLGPVSEFMINDYCGGLSGTFATLVYYGILDESDAQCFRVKAEVENGSFMLIAAALLLALFSSYVTRAFIQYQRAEATILHDDPTLSVANDAWYDENIGEAADDIHPVPVLFTDTFRWTLRREDVDAVHLSRKTRRGLDTKAKLGVRDSFPASPTVSWTDKMGKHSPKREVDTEGGSTGKNEITEGIPV